MRLFRSLPVGAAQPDAEIQARDVRSNAWGEIRNGSTELLHWEIAVDASSFAGSDLETASHRISELRTRAIVADTRMTWNKNIPKPLGALAQGEAAQVKARLDQATYLNLAAMRIEDFPSDTGAIQAAMGAARAQGARTIIAGHMPASLPLVENFAGFWNVDVAICGPAAQVIAAVSRFNQHMGVCLDSSALTDADIALVQKIKGRPIVLNVQGDAGGVPNAVKFLSAIYHAGDPGADRGFPALVVLKASGKGDAKAELGAMLDQMEQSLAPVVAEQMYYWSSITPIIGAASMSETDKRAVELALPRTLAKPRKARKLLVLDLNTGHPAHGSVAFANYAIDQEAKRTGAYSVTFSNDLHNFQYDKLKQYDAVFMNNTVGWHFTDPALREGLRRYMCEGGGLAGYHGAVYALLDWKEFADMEGASPLGGNVREDDERAWLKVDDPKNPITAAFPKDGFAHYDEYYRLTQQPYSRDHVRTLLSIDTAQTDMSQRRTRPQGAADIGMWRADDDYPVSWIHAYGPGRVFFSIIGHSPDLFTDKDWVAHIFAGIQYALGDLKVDDSPSNPNAARAHASAHCNVPSR